MKTTYRSLKSLILFLLLISTANLVSAAGETPKESPLVGQLRLAVVQKGTFELYVGGQVTELDQTTPISGALVTATYKSDDGVGDITYFDHQSYSGLPFQWLANGGTESHCITANDGFIFIRIDVDADNVWDAHFNICVSCEGYRDQCLDVDFDQGNTSQNRNFFLIPNELPTPTFTPTLTPTLIPTPTVTETPSGKPTAVHPELDVDHDGVIGAGDLLLLLADWMRPVN
jgi:hypothetical protein